MDHNQQATTSRASVTVKLAQERHPAVGRNRIYAAIASGDLKGIKVGKRIAIPTDELDLWVLAGCPVDG